MCIHCSSVSVSPLCAGHKILDSLQLCSPVVYNIDFECGFQKRSKGISDHCYQAVAFADHFLGTCSVEVLRLLINRIQSSAPANFLPSKWVCAEGHEWNCVAHWLERGYCFDEFSKRQNPKCIHAAVLTVCWVGSCIICTTATLRVTRDSAWQITPKGWIFSIGKLTVKDVQGRYNWVVNMKPKAI
jgi:hypothetical protein